MAAGHVPDLPITPPNPHMQQQAANPGATELESRIEQFEMAYRMQTAVPDATDISKEPESVLKLYGDKVKQPGSFERNCLQARRFAERGAHLAGCAVAGRRGDVDPGDLRRRSDLAHDQPQLGSLFGELLGDEKRAIYDWQNYLLWQLLVHKKYSDPHLINIFE